jgi:hypothetical protein
MPIGALDKIDALVAGVTRAEIEALPPTHRMRLAQALRHVADLADPAKPAGQRSGALARLQDGERAEDCTLPSDK